MHIEKVKLLDRAPSNITQALGPSIQASKQTRITKDRYTNKRKALKERTKG
jgi:hypothetical protein